jgi:hypothetical protein
MTRPHLQERKSVQVRLIVSTLANTLSRDKLSDGWFRRLRRVVFPMLPTNPRTEDRVKIAILDSGIDLSEDYIFLNPDRIKFRSFLRGDEGIEDLIGHGTHTAAVLLKVAPNADIFIARVTASGNLEDTACIERVRYPFVETVLP